VTVSLSHRETGAGPPLVILHGLFGSGRNWRSVAGLLAAHHRVFLVDQRNHGRSGHAPTMSYHDLARDVGAWMDDNALEHATVIGHSMGGKTAMTLARREPARVNALVVVDIAPVAYRHDHDALLGAMRGLDLDRISSRAAADSALAPAVPDPRLRAFLLHNLVRAGARLRWRINLDGIAASLSDLVGFPPPSASGTYSGPTLFVRGEQSDYLRDEHHAGIIARFPAARITTIPNAGHWVHAEQPARFVAAVERFLAG